MCREDLSTGESHDHMARWLYTYLGRSFVLAKLDITGGTVKSIVIAMLAGITLLGCATTNELPPRSQIKPSVEEESALANA